MNITRHFFIGYGSCISTRSGSGSYSGASGDLHPLLWSALHGDIINGVGHQVILFSDSIKIERIILYGLLTSIGKNGLIII